MKTIKLRFNARGRRTMTTDMSGFVGPAKKPMGNIPLRNGGDYIKPGEITSLFRLSIPPNGLCELVDVQHNRERLRVLTKPQSTYEFVPKYNEETGETTQVRQKVTHPPSFTVLDDTPIHEDIITEEQKLESKEVTTLKARIEELEAEKAGKKPARKEKTTTKAKAKKEGGKAPAPAPAPDTSGIPLEMEGDVHPDNKVPSSEELRQSRFASKKADPVSLV